MMTPKGAAELTVSMDAPAKRSGFFWLDAGN
jgi:hypothetical protein